MINIGGTDIGETIRNLRETRGMTRAELAEAVGISESHLKKIEAGVRWPGINTFQRITVILDIYMTIKDDEKTVKGKCIAKAQEILMNSTEAQATFMLRIMECMAQNMKS